MTLFHQSRKLKTAREDICFSPTLLIKRVQCLFSPYGENYLLVYLVCISKYGVNDYSTFILLPAFIPLQLHMCD